MNYFTFKKGDKPIAIIEGGSFNNKIVYINQDENDSSDDEEICCDRCNENCLKKGKKCCQDCNYINGGCGSCGNDDFDNIFKKQINNFKKGQMEYIKLKDGGKMIPLPRLEENQISHLFVSGPTGSGKSTFASVYIKQFLKLHPKSKVYIVSAIPNDEVLDSIKPKPKRLKIDEKMYEKPIPIELFENSIILFDDVDNIRDKKIKEAIQKLRDDVLANGRHYNINVISLTHNPTNNKETKSSLLESNSIVMFPHGGDDYHIKRVLKEYLSIPTKKIDEILKMKSRWIFINKSYPKYMISESGCQFPK